MKDGAIPEAHCIETGPEFQANYPMGYMLHFEQPLSGEAVLATFAALWDSPGVEMAGMERPDGSFFTCMLNESCDSLGTLAHLRSVFRSQTKLTGVVVLSPCECKHCESEGVIWGAIRVVDRELDHIPVAVARLRDHDSVLSANPRGDDTIIMKVRKTLVVDPGAFMSELTDTSLIHMESMKIDGGYGFRLAQWASERSPHDW